ELPVRAVRATRPGQVRAVEAEPVRESVPVPVPELPAPVSESAPAPVSESAPAPVREPEPAPVPPPVADDSRGRFPVLQKPSRAGRAPWRLPQLPSPTAIAADEAVLGGLEVRAASVVGPGHRGRGVARQDAYRIGQDSAGRYLLVAVADGMSDSKHSDVGANVAAAALVSALREALDRGVELERLPAREIFLAAAGQMYGAAEQRGWTADDVRAVAVVAVVPALPDSRGRRRCWLGAVADVSAWRLSHDRWEQLIGEEKGGFDASTVEHFLPHDLDHVDYGVTELGPGEVLAVTTDGVSDAFALGPGAQRWFAERWRRPPRIGSFLLDVGFEQAQMQDDRTAVVVWCADAHEGGER
ncbi:protein phosphatase 2C domain-containing protein, partial [Streptomyces sp. 150FB]|uniref:protein phosphatase 2C domain-containing protein n=1 Tax=Streptomyces sp. 150FB TaxID=1576605 RepID=UPI00099CFC2D